MDKVFTPLERQALLTFLKDYINCDSLSTYLGVQVKHLFVAYLKLQKEQEEWEDAMKYSE